MPERVKQLPSRFVDLYKEKTPPWGPVGYVVFKRTYARGLETGGTEEWYQTVERAVNGLLRLGGSFTEAEVCDIYDLVFNLKMCFSGRALWQLGTANMERIGADSLQNCWAVAVNEPIDPFCFTFNQLMLGGGVGFNITPEQVYSLPTVMFNPDIRQVDTYDCDFIVPDNREGWVKLLGRILKSFFYTGRRLHYCTKGVRGKGQPIKTFGGTACGDVDLVWGMGKIVEILQRAHGRKLKPIEVLDIMNIIGKIVVSGNVRRSAQIAVGDPRDLEYMAAKNWATGKIPSWRAMSNNSVVTNTADNLPDSFWGGYNGDGEPYGFVNLDLCRQFGRLLDGRMYRPDPGVIGTNPCAEITLCHKEACNLIEQFLCRIKDINEWKRVAYLCYKITKTISVWPFSDPDTNDIVSENHRLGISGTGIQQAWWWGPKHYDQVYRHIEQADEVYSKQLGVNRSNKLTTVKPSGTLSLLPEFEGGVLTPGTNDGYSPYQLRRIRFAADDPLIEVAIQHGYHVEPVRDFDGSEDYGTMVVSFPVKQVGAKQTSAIHQLKRHKLMQTYWSDNAVSTTVYYKREELEVIQRYLRENIPTTIKSVSFLLHSEHGFEQAPLEAISKERYEELTSRCTPITSIGKDSQRELSQGLECVSGACPVR